MKKMSSDSSETMTKEFQQISLVAQQLALIYIGLFLDIIERNTERNKNGKN